jgi:NTP-dependent ternary system trypsin peptidase co-occuring protein
MPIDDCVTGLADAIDALRDELGDAMVRGEGAGVRFRVKPVELTVQAVVTKGGDGKIGWGVVAIGGKLELATTQTLKLQLEPVVKTESGGYTTDFAVADQVEGEQYFGPRKGVPGDSIDRPGALG